MEVNGSNGRTKRQNILHNMTKAKTRKGIPSLFYLQYSLLTGGWCLAGSRLPGTGGRTDKSMQVTIFNLEQASQMKHDGT
jgi:hypothetical protein